MEWKRIPEFGEYAVSDTGLIKRRDRILKSQVSPSGVVTIHLQDAHGRQKQYTVARLVYQVFIGPLGGKQIAYRDGKKTNISKENLYVGTKRNGGRKRSSSGPYGGRDILLEVLESIAPHTAKRLREARRA